MLKINVSDVFKVLTVDDHGTCDDGRAWVRCSAMSFFDEDETYMVLTAFGPTADMILDNHTGNNMRRAFVNGTLSISMAERLMPVKFNGVVKDIKILVPQYQVIADTFRFIDTNTWGEKKEGSNIVEAEDNDEPIDLTGAYGYAGKSDVKVIYSDGGEKAATKESKDAKEIKKSKSARYSKSARANKRVIDEE